MKKAVWIPLLATSCTLVGAVAGAFAIMMKREKEMAEYEQMVIKQDISDVKWEKQPGETGADDTDKTDD